MFQSKSKSKRCSITYQIISWRYNCDCNIESWYDSLIQKFSITDNTKTRNEVHFANTEKAFRLIRHAKSGEYLSVGTQGRYRAVVSGMIRYFVWSMFLRGPCCEKRAISRWHDRWNHDELVLALLPRGEVARPRFWHGNFAGPCLRTRESRSRTELQSCIGNNISLGPCGCIRYP